MKPESPHRHWPVLNSLIGRKIASIHRLVFVYQGEMNLSDTPLQLTFEDGTVIYLDAEGDGESLRIDDRAWIDPFEGKLNKENEAFVQLHGKWTRQDASRLEFFKALLSQSITNVLPILTNFGKLAGVQIEAAGSTMSFVVEWDECHIYWGREQVVLHERGYVITKLNP